MSLLYHLPSWRLHALAWTVPFMVVVVAWLLSLVAVGRGPGSRLQRSLFGMGPAAVAIFAVLLVLRFVAWIDGWGDGPQHWLMAWIPPWIRAIPVGAWAHPYDVVLTMTWIASGVVFFSAPLSVVVSPPSARHPPRLNGPIPGGVVVTAVLALAALALPWLLFHAYSVDSDAWLLLDLVGVAPILALVVGLRVQARVPLEPPKIATPVAAPRQIAPPDIGLLWAEAGLVDSGAVVAWDRPPAGPRTPPSPRAQAAWGATGAPGEPPGALDTLLIEAATPGRSWLVGDLPADTAVTLFSAILADTIGAQGLRVLAIVPDPDDLAGRLRDALERAHMWEPGFVAVGPEALREALARRRLPACVLVTPNSLSEQLIRLVGWEGRRWAASLGLVLVHRPDAGSAIDVTHLAFTFKRWHLATGALFQPSVIATAPDTPANLAHLERLFPGRTPRRCPLAPRSSSEVKVLRARVGKQPEADPWVARAARVVIEAGEQAAVLDPTGHWDDLHLDGVPVHRDLDLRARATAADLGAERLAELYRAAPRRLPDGPHWSLWHVRPSPTARFLLVPGRLNTLTRRRELPVPSPVVGDRNRFLRTAHTLAALHEGLPDELSLRRAFGEDVVDYALRQCERTGAFRSRLEGAEVVRSPIIRPPSGQSWEDPHRTTVTPRAVAVVDDRSGHVLAHVDERLAATRYFPKRVFAVGHRLYRVPLHALDTKRSQIRVEHASSTDRLNKPLMRFGLEVRRLLVDRVTRREGALVLSTVTVEALVHEEVLAAWVPGRNLEERFDPVEASYDTEVRLVFPDRAEEGPGLFHLAATLDDLLGIHLQLADEDAEVVPVSAGFVPGYGPGLAFVDRHVGGMGLARALDAGTIVHLLRWARALLFECGCMEGCGLCTPERVLRARPAKQQVLRMLPAERPATK